MSDAPAPNESDAVEPTDDANVTSDVVSPDPVAGDSAEAGQAIDDAVDPVTVEELLVSLETVTGERDQYLSDLQRVTAEFANFRKQTDKRNAEFAAQAGSKVAQALLPVLDACDAALQQGVEGVEPISGQLRAELERCGLEVINDAGEPFDPNRHEAAMSQPGDDDQEVPLVGDILRTGYAWNGRVLRAAMVSVKG